MCTQPTPLVSCRLRSDAEPIASEPALEPTPTAAPTPAAAAAGGRTPDPAILASWEYQSLLSQFTDEKQKYMNIFKEHVECERKERHWKEEVATQRRKAEKYFYDQVTGWPDVWGWVRGFIHFTFFFLFLFLSFFWSLVFKANVCACLIVV
jgi:hypothetical protein